MTSLAAAFEAFAAVDKDPVVLTLALAGTTTLLLLAIGTPLRHCRAGRVRLVGAGEKDQAVAGKEITARGTASFYADQHRLAFSKVIVERIEDMDLIAGLVPGRIGGLENELAAVEAPIGLCIVTAEGELLQGLEVLLQGMDQGVGCTGGLVGMGR